MAIFLVFPFFHLILHVNPYFFNLFQTSDFVNFYYLHESISSFNDYWRMFQHLLQFEQKILSAKCSTPSELGLRL